MGLSITAARKLALSLLFLNGAGLVTADNPIIQTIYTADPAPYVYNDRLWLFADHDEPNSNTYIMKDWRLFATDDVVNWQDYGVVMSLKTFSWATDRAWAGQVVQRNNQFYYYAPMQQRSGAMAVGVGVSPNITGPYKDALGKPLVSNNGIDPTVWIDDDGQAYLYWGNPGLYYVKLNKDMLSYSGSIVTVNTGSGLNNFAEGPWFYKRNGRYYMVYAASCCPEDIRYSISSGPTGPWTYKGQVMATQGASFTNHPGVIDYKNQSLFFYHNGALPGGGGYDRSIAVEPFTYGSDGSIPLLKMTTAGAPQIGTFNPYRRVEAETMTFSSHGLSTAPTNDVDGLLDVGTITNGAYIKVKGVAFGGGATSFAARVAPVSSSGGSIELRLGSQTGTLVGTLKVPGGGSSWSTVNTTVSGATGTQDLYFHFTGGSGNLIKFNWWQFASSSSTH
jgi:arabinoxylan arabinofuranohydrolase